MELTVTVEVWEEDEEEGASMTAWEWEQGGEEVGWREKEMREEASVTTGWVEVSRLKGSVRLSVGGRRRRKTKTQSCVSKQDDVIRSKVTRREMH